MTAQVDKAPLLPLSLEASVVLPVPLSTTTHQNYSRIDYERLEENLPELVRRVPPRDLRAHVSPFHQGRATRQARAPSRPRASTKVLE